MSRHNDLKDSLWLPLSTLSSAIRAAGGFVNAHAHFDRAYSVTPQDFDHLRVESHLHDKWKLVDSYKEAATEESYFRHIWAALEAQHQQGVRYCLSFIDVDPVAGDRALNAAKRARTQAAKELQMRFLIAVQTLKGVLEPEPRDYFERSLEHVDVIGGLPGADKGRPEEHLDVLLAAVQRTGKRAHIHVDQLNSPAEKETELLCDKIMHWGVEGKVTAVHGISIAAHPKAYRMELYRKCVDAGLSFVSCPSAWIDSRRSEELQPFHNAVTPVDEMVPAGITVALGTDNIADVYKPYSDGDMTCELRMLLESCHFYDRTELVRIATANGKAVLGIGAH
jgi:cytosine/adenosine deaminase-related metal-dependent hydrolase